MAAGIQWLVVDGRRLFVRWLVAGVELRLKTAAWRRLLVGLVMSNSLLLGSLSLHFAVDRPLADAVY